MTASPRSAAPGANPARRNAIALSKGRAEVRKMGKAGFVGNLFDRAVGVDEKRVSALEASFEHESVDGLPKSALKSPFS
jgi:hypothetical protein